MTTPRDEPTPSGLTRREFAVGAGAAALLPVVGRVLPDAPYRSPWAPGEGAQEDGEAPPGTDALVGYLEARYGDRLSEDDLEAIRSGVAGNLRAAASIGEVELANGEGPATLFRAYRGDGP